MPHNFVGVLGPTAQPYISHFNEVIVAVFETESAEIADKEPLTNFGPFQRSLTLAESG